MTQTIALALAILAGEGEGNGLGHANNMLLSARPKLSPSPLLVVRVMERLLGGHGGGGGRARCTVALALANLAGEGEGNSLGHADNMLLSARPKLSPSPLLVVRVMERLREGMGE